MRLVNAFEAVMQMVGEAQIEGHFDLQAVTEAEDFWANNWEELAEKYDRPGLGASLPFEGAYPMDETTRLPVDEDKGPSMGLVLRKAFVEARDAFDDEVVLDQDTGESVNRMEAVRFMASFWVAHGEEICSQTASFDVSSLMEDEGMQL